MSTFETEDTSLNAFDTEVSNARAGEQPFELESAKISPPDGYGPNIPDISIGDYLRDFLGGKTWTLIVMSATFLALFQVDICQMYFSKRADIALAYVTFGVFIIFFFEMVLNFVLKIDYGANPCPKQFSFYMVLDSVGTLSLIPDFLVIFGVTFSPPSGAVLARVARTARIGARLTRLMKLFRSKGGSSVYSSLAGEDEIGTMEESAASGFGSAVSDGISKRVVLLTLTLLIAVPLFLPDIDGVAVKQEALDFLENIPTDALIRGFVHRNGALHQFQDLGNAQLVYFALRDDVSFQAPGAARFRDGTGPVQGGCETYYPKQSQGILAETFENQNNPATLSNYMYCDEDGATWQCPVACLGRQKDKALGEYAVVDWEDDTAMRKSELHRFWSERGTMTCTFYYRDLRVYESLNTVIYMLFNIVVFGAATGMFLSEVFDLVVEPMERMCAALTSLTKTFKNLSPEAVDEEDEEGDELASLGVGIIKLTELLKVGLGSAGTALIRNNLKGESNNVDPMVSGTKVDGYYGFCDIRNFRFLTKALGNDIMVLVNIIGEQVHQKVSSHLGNPNKNIGDSFLSFWSGDEEKVYATEGKMNFADHALVAFAEILAQLDTHPVLKELCDREELTDGYKIKMGFGLHHGWAIEGAVGSSKKIDVTYLSPHVNMSARLESATRLFQVAILTSEEFFRRCTTKYQRWLYRIDRVILPGMTRPVTLYAYDEGADENNPNMSKKTRYASEFDQGIENYIAGEWEDARSDFKNCLLHRPDDPATQSLLDFMESVAIHGGEAPATWAGYRQID